MLKRIVARPVPMVSLLVKLAGKGLWANCILGKMAVRMAGYSSKNSE